MTVMLARPFRSFGRLAPLWLAALALLMVSACSGSAANHSAGPDPSVQDQLAQLAADVGPGPTVVSANSSATAVRPAPTRTRAPSPVSVSSPGPTRRPASTSVSQPTKVVRPTRTPAPDGLATIQRSDLPPEARRTIALIEKGGPFPYEKDGATFGNREGLLPKRPSGYYKEFTVITPGARDRGARRIVAGAGGELYYTDDHYDSFRRVVP